MAIKRRQNKLQDLAASGIITNRISGSIPFEYSGPNSPLFTISEIPNPAPQGKSSFLIAGTELLKNSIEVKIELIDSEGGVIYTEPVANYLEGNARRVSIEVYDDTPAGPANLFILAMVDPEEWEDETGTDVTNFPNPSPPKNKGLRKKKKRRKQREKRKQMFGMPELDDIRRMGAGAFFINPNFRPPPGNDSRFRRRRGRRRRGTTSDISDQYNFLQKVEMQIVPTATNTEKILFYQEPRIRVFEAFKPFVSNLAQTGSIVVSGSAEAQVINDTQTAGSTTATDSFGQGLSAFRRKRKFKKFAGKGGLSKRKRITRRASPEVDNYSISSDSFTFTSKHVGGKLILDNPSVNTTQFPASRFTVPTTGSFEIIKVNNSSTIIPDKPFQIFDNQLQQHVDAPITHTSFSLEFDPEVTRSISVTNFRSYADVRVSNIRTFSGDVFRTKIYRKSEESIGDYELFADLPLESSELLLNANEGTGLERTGYFVSQEDIGKFWHVSQSLVGVAGATSASVASYDIDKQMDSVYISGSNRELNQFVQFKLRDAYKFQLEKNVDYDFSANIYGQATSKVVELETGGTEVKQLAELEVYISGSKIPAQLGNENFGAKLGVIRINDGSTEKDFKLTTGDFESTALSPGCNLIFKVNAGKFYISDISIRPATETGFSPDLFTFQAPMPSNETRPETYEFIAEFYDVNNNQADAFCFTPSGSTFQGSNMVITGGDNVLESNLFIGGESTASGMHLGGVTSTLPETGTAGAAGSGFMRSVGYTGFTSASNDALGGTAGFMIYSGSVLPDSGDNYNGVGMELISKSGSLRFSTNPSRFEVKADAFFVGKTHLESATGVGQFISGAQGNVEISSSNFHLTRNGDVTMQGTITATAGNIGGFTILGAPLTPAIASPDKSLILSGSGQITGSNVLFTGGVIGGFAINNNAISSSNNQLRLKSSGQITGSNVLFEGGKIGGLTISGNNLSAGTSYRLSSSVDLADPVSFISSSNFKVSAGGLITGSNVLFTGGTIAGWAIGDTTLTGGNLILSKDGSIRSSNYQSDFAGWKISAEENGFAEFENVKIRGTLSTTTFEKESVNAVGGQLFVANSTAITGSSVAASDATMSVVNASGFQTGEVIIAKKVTNTGFTTEYISVDSASLDGDLTKDELHGRLYVTRSIASSFPNGTDSGSVGDSGGNAQDYEPGQVLASTGRIGTGYIRINANPNTLATPYIDIVERTGSAPYDVELKTRVGDLSGVAGSRNVPLGFSGFGIMSEVAFLSGSNIKLEAPAFLLGDRNSTFVSGSNGKIEVSSSAFHLKNDGQLLVGDKSGGKYIEWDNSNLVVRGDLSVDNLRTPSDIGGSPPTHANASASISSSGQVAFRGEFFLGNSDTAFISSSNNLIEVSSSTFHLSSSGNLTFGTSNVISRTKPIGTQDLGASPNVSYTEYLTRVNGNGVTNSKINNEQKVYYPGTSLTSGNVPSNPKNIVVLSSGAAVSSTNTLFKNNLGIGDNTLSTQNGFISASSTITGLQPGINIGSGSKDSSAFYATMWVNMTQAEGDFSSTPGTIFTYGDKTIVDNGDFGMGCFVYDTKLYWSYWSRSSTSSTIKGDAVKVDDIQTLVGGQAKWFHLGVAKSGLTMQIYINGVQQISNTITSPAFFNFRDGVATKDKTVLSFGAIAGKVRFSNHLGNNISNSDTIGANSMNNRYSDMRVFLSPFRDDATTTNHIPPTQFYKNLYQAAGKAGPAFIYDNINKKLDVSVDNIILGDPETAFVSSSNGNLELSSSKFTIAPEGDVIANQVTASNALFTGIAKSDVFEFTKLTIDSNNCNEYMTMYSGSDMNGGGTIYSKLDLSGITSETKAFVKIGVRAKNPIAHIEPPVDNGLTILRLQFSGQTTGTTGQYLIWSFAGANHSDLGGTINQPTSNLSDTGPSDNTGQFRAVSGSTSGASFQDGGRRGGIYFFHESQDRFRGIVSRKTVNVGNITSGQPEGNATTNLGGSFTFEMLHQVEKNAVYTFLCKEGAWFLLDITNSSTGSTHSRIIKPSPFALLVGSIKASKVIFGKEDKTGDNAVTGSETGAQHDLNLGGSLANVDTGTSARFYELLDGDDWTTGRTTSLSSRDGMMYVDFTRRSEIQAPFNYIRYYDVFRYNNSEDGTYSNLSIRQSVDDDEHIFQWGTGDTEGTMDKIKIHPQSGSIAASGGVTSHQLLVYSHANGQADIASQTVTLTLGTPVSGVNNGKGYRMIRDGSIVGCSYQLDTLNPAGTVPAPDLDVNIEIFKNGSSVTTGQATNGVAGAQDIGNQRTFIPGTHTFSAGDTIACKINCTNNSAVDIDVDDINALVEIQTNPTFGEPSV